MKFKLWGSKKSSATSSPPDPAATAAQNNNGTSLDGHASGSGSIGRKSRLSSWTSSRSKSVSHPADNSTRMVNTGTASTKTPDPPEVPANANYHSPQAGKIDNVAAHDATTTPPTTSAIESKKNPQAAIDKPENQTTSPAHLQLATTDTSRETGAKSTDHDHVEVATSLISASVQNVTRAGAGLAINPHSRIVDAESSSLPQSSLVAVERPVSRTNNRSPVPGLQRKSTLRTHDNRILDTSRHLWETAFIQLADSDREILQKHIHSLAPSGSLFIIDGLVQSVAERKTQIDRKRGGMLTFSWKGRVFNLSKVMDDIVDWAERFKVIGDTIVQYDPGHMALPWAAARFLLQIVTEDRANMTAITITIERVTNVSTLSAIYIGMYLDNRILSPVCFNRLQATLIKLHQNILSIVARAVRYLKNQGGLGFVVRSLFEYDNFEGQLHEIDRSLQELRDDVDVAEREIVSLNQQWQQDTYSRLKSLLKGLGGTLEKLERSAEALEKDMQDKKRNDLLTWVSACPYKRHHEDVLRGETILEGTGQWLFETDEFIDWIQNGETSVLWLNGEPGVGKSHVTYAAIELLQNSRKHSNMLSYFYCSRRDNDRTRSDPEAIVRALLKAVLMESSVDPELVSLETRYKQRTDRGELNLKEAQKYLQDLLQQPECRGVLIFIDALDEVDKRDRMHLLTVIGDIVTTTGTKVWIASRPEADIQRALVVQLPKKAKRNDIVKDVSIAKRNKGEIARYIEREIDARIETGELLDGDVDDETRELILMKLQEKGDGMYLWVHLQILSLCNLMHVSYVRQQLEELPQGLDDTYRVIYNQIITTPNIADRANAVSALKWLCATTPLKFGELAQLVKYTNVANNHNAPLIMDPNYLHKLCHNLVAIDLHQDVRLVHLSVREFLETQLEFSAGDSTHEMAVRTCLNHLITDSSSLMPYAVQNWTRHYRQAIDAGRKVPEITALAAQFLKETHTKWLAALSDEDLSPDLDPLFTIARYNLHELFQDVFGNPKSFNINPQARTASKQTPLHLAVKFGHQEAVRNLLNAPEGLVDVNAQDQDGRTPLALAILLREHKSIELLVGCPAVDLNIADTVGGFTPFVRAAWLGDDKTMKLFLGARDADVPDQPPRLNLDTADRSSGRTAFHWAVLRQNTKIIRLLVESGANVNAQDRTFQQTPVLTWASNHCRLSVMYLRIPAGEHLRLATMKTELQRGLDILRELCRHPDIDLNLRKEVAFSAHGSLLMNHSFDPSLGTEVELLAKKDFVRSINLEAMKIMFATKSFDINAGVVGASRDMPLIHGAADFGFEDILTIMLDHKSDNPVLRLDVNIIGLLPFPRTSLATAVSEGHVGFIKLLLDPKHGVDPRIPDWEGKTPLQRAIIARSWVIAKILIGAEGLVAADEVFDKLVTENEEGLMNAAEQSHVAVLQFCGFSSDGPVEDPKIYHGSTNEHHEAHLQIKKVYLTALKAADDPQAQNELLTLDINFRDTKGFSTLHYAIISDLCSWKTTPEERITVVRVLSATPGINLNQLDGWGATPLYHSTLTDSVPIEIFNILLAADGIDVNGGVFTPFVGATTGGGHVHKNLWKAFLRDPRVHLDARTQDTSTVLGRAARREPGAKLVRALLATGRVDPNLKSILTGLSPLSEAVSNSVHSSVKMLLDHPGIDVDSPDLSWDTPLTIGVRLGDPKIVKALLKKKPNLSWKNHKGLTPMEIAVEEGHVKIVELLNDAMDDEPDVFGNDISDLEDLPLDDDDGDD